MSRQRSEDVIRTWSGMRVGVALGGGAARGWAHIGVLRALEEAGIRPYAVAGTSIGAFVGAAYAAGGLDALEEAVRQLDWRALVTFFDVGLPRPGLVGGRRVVDELRRFVPQADVRDLPTSFRAVATDLRTGEAVVLDHGDPVEVVRASIAVPGLFTPVHREGRLLVDGALVKPVPVDVAREMDVDVVIGVDICHFLPREAPYMPRGQASEEPDAAERTPLARWMAFLKRWPWMGDRVEAPPELPAPNLVELLLSSVAVSEAALGDARLALDPPDLLVRPEVGHIRFLDFHRAAEAIEAGREATRAALLGLHPRPWPARAVGSGPRLAVPPQAEPQPA